MPGKVMPVKLPEKLHAEVLREAEKAGLTPNAWMRLAAETALGITPDLNTTRRIVDARQRISPKLQAGGLKPRPKAAKK
jgi:hypothetical protein